jgi:hypothetical protein
LATAHTELVAFGVGQHDIVVGHSRLKASSDNPFIEASFKTSNTIRTFPTQFGSVQLTKLQRAYPRSCLT